MTAIASADPPSAPVQAVLDGAAHVLLADGTRVELNRKQAAVIAWLAVHGPTPRARLAGMLWPDANEERARGNLRQRLSRLRHLAGDIVGDDHGLLTLARDLAIATPAPGAQWLDAFEYADCSEFAAWLDAERESRHATRRQMLLASVRASAQSGALDQALAQADELLAFDRESEEAYRALMEVFYLRGDRAAAIAVWDRCREMLRGLYGVLPSAATQRLGHTILESAGSATTASASAAAIPVTVLRPPRLVGRVGIVDALVSAWRIGNAVCVSGEGGVGKSRVLAEFSAAIGPCASVAARPGDAMLPYASLSRLVLAAIDRFRPALDTPHAAFAGRLLTQITSALGVVEPEPLRTQYERDEAIVGLATLLSACVDRGCAAFVFDDLQFADLASVEVLQALVERSTSTTDAIFPARLALGSRGEEQTARGAALLASLTSARRLLQIELEPLGEAGVLELMQSLDLPGFAAAEIAPRLRRQVGGNPAFLLESVKLMAALGKLADAETVLPVPPGIEAVVERRLALLSPMARHIAELAAIAGESYSVGLAARALARPLAELGEPLRELESRQVVYGRQFVHDVVASAVRRTIPAVVAEFLDRFVAEQLEAAGGEPAVIAGHWRACAEWRRAADCFRAAADKARRSLRAAELAQMLDAAAECYALCGARAERFVVLRERLKVTTTPDFGRTCRGQLDELAASAGNDEERLHVMVATVTLDADRARSDTIAMGEEGLRRARALGLEQLAFDFAHPLAWQYAVGGEPERGLEALEACRSWVLAQSDLFMQSRFYTARQGTYALSDRIAEAIADSRRAIELLRTAGDEIEMLAGLANLGLLLGWRGEFAAARDVLIEGRALRDKLHGRGSSALIEVHLGSALRDLGDYRQALGVLETALAEYQTQLIGDAEMRTDVVICEHQLAQLWLLLGQPERAEACLQSDASATAPMFRARRATLRLRAARARGANDEALLASSRELTLGLRPSFNRMLAELELCRGAEPRWAAAELAMLSDTPAMNERPGLRMTALALRARALREMGNLGEARVCVEALLILDERYMPYDAAPPDIWAVAHAVLTQLGDRPRAAALADKATAWLRATYAHGLPEEARQTFLRRHETSCRAIGISLA
ncbi:MAG: AAA family ATPase [Caldimonas sp.]